VYGWDLRDCLSRKLTCAQPAVKAPKDDLLKQRFNEDANGSRSNSAFCRLPSREWSWPDAVLKGRLNSLRPMAPSKRRQRPRALNTLTVHAGCEPTPCVSSTAENSGGAKRARNQNLKAKDAFQVWDPVHFAKSSRLVAAESRRNQSAPRHPGTVPHVTVPDSFEGVGRKVGERLSNTSPNYTRPWISDDVFEPPEPIRTNGAKARAVDIRHRPVQRNDRRYGQVSASKKAKIGM